MFRTLLNIYSGAATLGANSFRKKALLKKFDMVLNTPLNLYYLIHLNLNFEEVFGRLVMPYLLPTSEFFNK